MSVELSPNVGLRKGWETGENGWGEAVNFNWLLLDVVSVPFAHSATVTIPPLTPAEGDRYIIPMTGATGEWADKPGRLAYWHQQQWIYFQPAKGWYQRVWDTQKTFVWDGAAWNLYLDAISEETMASINRAAADAAAAASAATNALTAAAQVQQSSAAILSAAQQVTTDAQEVSADRAVVEAAANAAANAVTAVGLSEQAALYAANAATAAKQDVDAAKAQATTAATDAAGFKTAADAAAAAAAASATAAATAAAEAAAGSATTLRNDLSSSAAGKGANLVKYGGSTVQDELTSLRSDLNSLPGASGAIIAAITASALVLPADSAGAVQSYLGAVTTMAVQRNGAIDAGWSFSKVDGSGVTSTLAGSTVTVTALSNAVDVSYVDITATKMGFPTQSVRVSITKAKAGATGSTGAAGTNTATITIYQRGVTQPALPTAVATYTFATAALTGLNGGWSTSIPAGTAQLWAAASTASSTLASDTIASNEWSTPVVLAANGTNGVNGNDGLNVATVYLYRRTATNAAPALPSATVTYTFSTGVASGLTNSWAQTVPSSGGSYLWVTTATAAAAATVATDAISTAEWAAASLMAQDGANGATGNFLDYVFIRSATQPATPSGTGTPAGWSDGPPAGTDPLWTSVVEKTSGGALVGAWSAPVRLDGANGANGTNGANGNDGQSVSVEYSVDGSSSWHSTFANGDKYMRQRVGAGAWSGAIKIVGENGANGTNGTNGANGQRGSVQTSVATSGTSWSDTEAVAAIANGGYGAPVNLDRVTLVNIGAGFVQTKYYLAGSWIVAAVAIDGNLIVNGTVAANALAANSVTADKVAAGAVTADKIAAGSITAAKIAAGALTADTLSVGSITAEKIVAGAVVTSSIQPGAVSIHPTASGSGSTISVSVPIPAGETWTITGILVSQSAPANPSQNMSLSVLGETTIVPSIGVAGGEETYWIYPPSVVVGSVQVAGPTTYVVSGSSANSSTNVAKKLVTLISKR